MSHPHWRGTFLDRQLLHRGAAALLLAGLLLPGLAVSAEPGEDVPDWALPWKQTWIEGRKNGTLQLSGRLTPRFIGSGRQELFAVVEVRALDFPQMESPPASVMLVMDRSASTQGRQLLMAKKAALEVISQLTERDRLGVVLVSDNPRGFPIAPATAEHRAKMKALVEGTLADGRSDFGTAFDYAFADLSQPAEQAFYRQVILISDGKPTDGMVDPAGLAEIAREAREKHSIHTSTVSVGEDSNFELMAGIAKEGWGFAARVSDSSLITRVAKRQRLAQLRRAASATELILKVPSGFDIVGVYGHDGIVGGNTVRVLIGEVGPGEVIRVVLHLRAEEVGRKARSLTLVKADLQYENAFTEGTRTSSFELKVQVDPELVPGRVELDLAALRLVSRAFAERSVARADEIAEEGDLPAAERTLADAREALKVMGTHARLVVIDALTLLYARGREVLAQHRPAAKKKPPEKAKKRR
ncbi:MAG: VWA domain-containing protein [Myxococcaceae bacterium]|nr:VWA domain-containing protein [Myxococcaceae bacterium]